ncbi:hypothetical protein CN692_04075 [Bacillus sp. AFS002410]|uniref:hypothetical protein n=1 Tax=Bacillus sp. AFS002410 TaxID=2033481 RepID=UPI000BF0199E|nr:hypothetical protein [Bacillus sp. AFS002410]PEJ59965.1 hypothetical protein CN692_04075 [Bacillus sp. AFS002410]
MSKKHDKDENKPKEKYDGVHLLAMFAIVFIREYFHLSYNFFFIAVTLYMVVAYYYLEKWKMRRILKYVILAVIAFLISKFFL